jgi:hypothetical protein
MVRLPDPDRSYAVLIGSSRYESEGLPDLPAVRNNVADLAAAITNPEMGCLPVSRCVSITEPGPVREVYRELQEYARRAEDTLLVYYAGHGLTGPVCNELYLALPDTDLDARRVTAIAFDLIRDVFHDCPATNRVLILDCCFSGRAAQGFMTGSVLDQTEVSGTYTLASTPANALGAAPPRARHTAFTGELLALLQNGIPHGPELLTLGAIARRLRHTMRTRGLPIPTQHGTDTADLLALARNPAYRRPPLPDPPPGLPAPEPVIPPEPLRHRGRLRSLVSVALIVIMIMVSTSGLPDRSNPTGSAATTPAAQPDRNAMDAAQRWAEAWVHHPRGRTVQEWLAGLRPYTTDERLAVMATVDPQLILATEVTGNPLVKNSFRDSLEVVLATNGGTLSITVNRTSPGWRVADYDYVHPGAPNPKTVPVRVYNNTLIDGLARQMADNLRSDGWNVADVGNYSRVSISATTAYFRPGTVEEATARILARNFSIRVEQRFADIENGPTGVIILVTGDYRGW